MIRRTLSAMLAVPAALAVAGVAHAGDEFLSVGDKAPAIDVSHWLKGSPVNEFKEGKIYVVEFWATWCGPCKASVPHIADLQERYKDYNVTFLGVSDEPLPTVVQFLCQKSDDTLWNEKMAYTVATDPDRSVYADYMLSAGQTGIPTAFLIGKDRHIEWIGHPKEIDEPLDAVVRDAWDRDDFKKTYDARMAPRLEEMGEYIRYQKAVVAKDYRNAVKRLDTLIAEGRNPSFKIEKFKLLAGKLHDYSAAYGLAGDLVKDHWENPGALNDIAWFIVDEPGLDQRDLDIAMKAARRASELTEDENAAILDTLARVYYEQGDLDMAIVKQRLAVKYAQGAMVDPLTESLKKYEAKAAK